MIILRAVLIVHLCALCSAFLPDPPTLTIPSGEIQGKTVVSEVLKRNYAAFYSIPYAKPPIAELRFKEPVPAEPWKWTLLATEPPPMCLQLDVLNPSPNVLGSEDCLYLNVFTPRLPENNTELMDVIFLIHGGGFAISSGNHLSADRLMDKDVVVVTMNYRLGPLGFLSTEDIVSPGNNGLKDQNLALKWTNENIAYFGGDPNKITISGCSAGGASVHYHLLSKSSKGLFHKAIPESGSALNPWAFQERPKREAVKIATALGCPTNFSDVMIECLKQKPANHIILKHKSNILSLQPEMPFVPSVEPPHPTAFFDKHPREVMASGEASDVPILWSFSQDEGLLFATSLQKNTRIRGHLPKTILFRKIILMENHERHYAYFVGISQLSLKLQLVTLSDPSKLKEVEDNWKETVVKLVTVEKLPEERKLEVGNKFREQYLGNKTVPESKRGLVKMMGDWGFSGGIEESSKLMAKVNKAPIYSYQFAYRGKVDFTPLLAVPEEVYKGVRHCEQSLYVVPFFGCKVAEDEPMSEVMINLAMKFIKGEPLAENWKSVKEGLPKYSLFKITSSQWKENELEEFDDFSNTELWKYAKRE